MDAQTAQGSREFQFTANECQVEVSMDQFQQQLKIRLKCLKSRNIYESTFDESTLPQELTTFLSNIKTVYEYIDVNRNDPQKIIIEQTGLFHLVFVLSFGPNSQIKKQIVLQTQLKQVGSVQGSNFKQHFEKLRKEILEMNLKCEQQRKKLKTIILTVQKSNQRLVCESEALKLENIQFRKKFVVTEQKLNAFQLLLKVLYTQFENLRDEKQQIEKRLQPKLVDIALPNLEGTGFKRYINNSLQAQQKDNDIFQTSQEDKNILETWQKDYNILQASQRDNVALQISQKGDIPVRISQKDNQSSIIKRLKSLQQERDQQKKKFQQKLAQKQRELSDKISDIQRNTIQFPEQFNSQAGLLKDSDFQQLRNTVSSYNSKQKKQLNKNQIVSDTSLTSVAYELKRKIGLTGKYYCGGKLCEEYCTMCKGPCGPFSGQNCSACMKLDLQRRKLKKGFLVNANGQVSWLQNGHFCCGIGCENGTYNCGPNQKYCQWCQSLTQHSHRYKQLL